jgi:phosphatidylinositol glycan class W
VLQFVILFIPCVISYAISDTNTTLAIFISLLCASFSYYQTLGSTHILPKTKKNSNIKSKVHDEDTSNLDKPGYVTIYRAYLQILTVIAILAVDFHIFPRKYAKTESYGYSLMDIGVGSFVFSQGLVFGPRLYKTTHFLHVLRSVFIVLAIGFARMYFTKTLEYNEHVSEYGVHWNFFFTLGFLPLFVFSLSRVLLIVDATVIAAILMIGYEYVLQNGLEDYIMNAPRIDLLSMNREGVFSFVGTVSLGIHTHSNRVPLHILCLCFYGIKNTQETVHEYVSRIYNSDLDYIPNSTIFRIQGIKKNG